jgi:hypothetical protein
MTVSISVLVSSLDPYKSSAIALGKDQYKIKRDTLTSGEINLLINR